MIAVDTSVLVAMVKEEPDHERLRDAIVTSRCVIAAPTVLEAKMALSSVAEPEAVDRFLQTLGSDLGLASIDFTPAMAEAAVSAFRRFGKGQGHPARLNFGDCIAYGTAKVLDVPLLYKGNDFAQTDIRPALP